MRSLDETSCLQCVLYVTNANIWTSSFIPPLSLFPHAYTHTPFSSLVNFFQQNYFYFSLEKIYFRLENGIYKHTPKIYTQVYVSYEWLTLFQFLHSLTEIHTGFQDLANKDRELYLVDKLWILYILKVPYQSLNFEIKFLFLSELKSNILSLPIIDVLTFQLLILFSNNCAKHGNVW